MKNGLCKNGELMPNWYFRPANSCNSAMSLTIFLLFSRPHNKAYNLTAFGEKSF